jgi:hypothetical protein
MTIMNEGPEIPTVVKLEDDYGQSRMDAVDLEDMDSMSITTTVGSGPNKRKEVMTLPLPPGSLPPRKRAKTKDEKEQRRIERIMRNRQAAHASREKKRKHVDDLEKKCVSLSTENEDLQKQVRQAKESQVQMLEQHYLLVAKVQHLQSVVKTAKATGDLSVLDSEPNCAEPPMILNNNVAIEMEDDCASPDSLILSSFTAPSLSSSMSNSPVTLADSLDLNHDYDDNDDDDDDDDEIGPISPTIKTEQKEDFYSVFDSSFDNRTHHPAEMMCLGLQRRSMSCLKTVLKLMI